MTHAANAPATRRLTFRQGLIFVLLPFAAGYYLSYLTRTLGALISHPMAADLHLTPADLGLLTSSYFFTFAVGQLPLGVALDRYGPRAVQLALLPVAALGAALFAIGQDPTALAFARGLMGLGLAGALMAGLKAIAQSFPPQRVALANGILIMLGGLGAVTATAPAEMLLRIMDWRSIFTLLAVVAVASTILVAVAAPRRIADAGATRATAKPPLSNIYLDARFWRLAPLSAGLIGTSFAMQGLWAAPWLSDVAHLGRDGVVGALLGMACAMCAGAIGLGIIADRLRSRGVRSRDMLVVMAVLSMSAQLALVLRLPVPALLPWLVLAIGASATVLSYAAIAEIFPSAFAGRANSALNVLHMGGAFAIQSGIGFVVAHWTADAAGHAPPAAYEAAFAVNLLPQALALIWFFAAPLFLRTSARLRPAATSPA